MKIKHYIDYEVTKERCPEELSPLHKNIYKYAHSHRYLIRELKDKETKVLQLVFTEEDKERMFIEWIRNSRVALIEPKELKPNKHHGNKQ